jgi:hypothetical protein
MQYILDTAIYAFHIWRKHEYLIYLQPIKKTRIWTELLDGQNKKQS